MVPASLLDRSGLRGSVYVIAVVSGALLNRYGFASLLNWRGLRGNFLNAIGSSRNV